MTEDADVGLSPERQVNSGVEHGGKERYVNDMPLNGETVWLYRCV